MTRQSAQAENLKTLHSMLDSIPSSMVFITGSQNDKHKGRIDGSLKSTPCPLPGLEPLTWNLRVCPYTDLSHEEGHNESVQNFEPASVIDMYAYTR